MRSTLVLAAIAMLCMSALSIQPTRELSQMSSTATVMPDAAFMIGAGVIRTKSGNNYTIESDDTNTYQATSELSYVVGAYVLHSDPVNGCVEILGYPH